MFTRRIYLTYHLKDIHCKTRRLHKCEECSARFISVSGLKMHIQWVHKISLQILSYFASHLICTSALNFLKLVNILYSQAVWCVVNQMNQIYAPKPCFLKIHFNIVVSSTYLSLEWYFRIRLLNQRVLHIFHLPRAQRMPHPSISSSLIYHPKIFGEEYKLWSFSSSFLAVFCSLPSLHPFFVPNILLSALVSTPSVCILPVMWKTNFYTHTNNR